MLIRLMMDTWTHNDARLDLLRGLSEEYKVKEIYIITVTIEFYFASYIHDRLCRLNDNFVSEFRRAIDLNVYL